MLTDNDLNSLKTYVEDHTSKVKELNEKSEKLAEEIKQKCEEVPSWIEVHQKQLLYIKMSDVSYYINKLSQFVADIEKENQELKQFILLLGDLKLPTKILDVYKTKTKTLKEKISSLQNEAYERRTGLQTLFKLYTNFQFIATSTELN